MLIVFHPIKGWYIYKAGDEGIGNEGNDGITYTVGYIYEMEAGPMVDESWTAKKM